MVLEKIIETSLWMSYIWKVKTDNEEERWLKELDAEFYGQENECSSHDIISRPGGWVTCVT
jgi:hypothetical protein